MKWIISCFFILLTVACVGIYITSRNNTEKQGVKVYKGLTLSEENIVRQNIDNAIENQKQQARTESSDTSEKVDISEDNDIVTVDHNSDKSEEDIDKPSHDAADKFQAKIDEIKKQIPDGKVVTNRVDEPSEIDPLKINNEILSNLGISIPSGGMKKTITTKAEAQAIISYLESKGDASKNPMIDYLKNIDFDGNVRVEVHIPD